MNWILRLTSGAAIVLLIAGGCQREAEVPAPVSPPAPRSPIEVGGRSVIQGTARDGKSAFQDYLQQAFEPGADTLFHLSNRMAYTVQSQEDAEDLCRVLESISTEGPISLDQATMVTQLADHFLEVESYESPAFAVLKEKGIPQLVVHFDRMFPLCQQEQARGGAPSEMQWKLMDLVAVLAVYQTKAATDRVVAAARAEVWPYGKWENIFYEFTPGSPYYDHLWDQLTRPFPDDYKMVEHLLSVGNSHALDEEFSPHVHPFDFPEGIAVLRRYLHDGDLAPAGFQRRGGVISEEVPPVEGARLAAEALPFLKSPERDALLAMAHEHSNQIVQLEAAWASGKLGRPEGIERLVDFCLDLNASSTAQTYLHDLGREDAIPQECQEHVFQLRATCAEKLAALFRDPGRLESLELIDHRSLHWPTQSQPMWLVRFRARFHKNGESWTVEDVARYDGDILETMDLGVGWFQGKTPTHQLAQRPPEDIYALFFMRMAGTGQMVKAAPPVGNATALPDRLTWKDQTVENVQAKEVVTLDIGWQGTPVRSVVVATGTNKGQPGWLALQGDQSHWYSRSEMPDKTTTREIAHIHLGLQALGLLQHSDRAAFLRKADQ